MGRKRKAEWLPWYRVKNYAGDLTESEKRQLDAFRTQPKHPAAQIHELPEEVQDYINCMELELYDFRQERITASAVLTSVAGTALIALNYVGCLGTTVWAYFGGAVLLTVPWVFYVRDWRKNASDFVIVEGDAPNSANEAIRKQWELNRIVEGRLREPVESELD